jgi:phosphoglycerol transferase MdoB-like AlkP superfamily enzyme
VFPVALNRWAWRLILAQWGAVWAVFTAYRLAFLVLYRGEFAGAPVGDVLLSLLHGARFDLSVIAVCFGPLGLLLLLASPRRGRVAAFWVHFVAAAALAAAMFVLQGIDLFYYGYVGRRVGFEAVAMLNEWRPIAALILRAYLLPTAVIAILLAGLLALAARMLRRLAARPYAPVGWAAQSAQIAALFAALVLVGRGGVQVKPISEGMAFLTSHLALGHLSLNAVFTAAKAAGQNRVEYAWLPDAEAQRVTLDLLGARTAPPRPEYPLWRNFVVPPSARPRNLVVLVLESFSPRFIGALGGTPGVTPEFDRLAREGLLFTNFHASGTRSLEGIPAILTGYPALPNATLLGSPLEQNSLSSLPAILKAHGYRTVFVHGAYRGSMWFDSLAARSGFDRFIAKEDFPDPRGQSDSTWGIFDHYALERLHQELESAHKPVFGFYFSLSSHTPYELPDPRTARFPAGDPDARMLNSFAYADAALGQFFERARRSSYWKDTVFMVTADHNLGGPFLDPRRRMHIPLLIVNPAQPGFPRGAADPTLGTQVSLAPTALQLLGISAPAAFASNSLLAPAPRRFGLFAWGSQAGWINETWLVVHDLARPIAVYDWRKDPALARNVLGETGGAEHPAVREFSAYLQTVNNLLVRNRVAPRNPGR